MSTFGRDTPLTMHATRAYSHDSAVEGDCKISLKYSGIIRAIYVNSILVYSGTSDLYSNKKVIES